MLTVYLNVRPVHKAHSAIHIDSPGPAFAIGPVMSTHL